MGVDPVWQAGVGACPDHEENYYQQFRQQVNGQCILSEDGKEMRPPGLFPELYDIDEEGQEDAIESYRIQHEGTGP